MENGEILEALKEKLESLLQEKRLPKYARAQLEVQQLFLLYFMQDHPKVTSMWAVFRPMAWAMGIAAATIITLLVSGRVEVIFK